MEKILLSFLSLVISLSAVSINDVRYGDIYYINSGITGEDRRVIVTDVYTSSKRIKVRNANGDTEVVNSSQLLTKQENDNENTTRNTMMGLGLLYLIGTSGEK